MSKADSAKTKSLSKVSKVLTAQDKQNAAMSAFVSRSEANISDEAEVKSMSPMMKPDKWPAGKILTGRLKKFFTCGEFKDSNGNLKIGTGVEIVPEGAKVGVALALVATLRMGLEVTGDGKEATSDYIGRIVHVELLPDRLPSKRGQDAWHYLVAIEPEGV